jgi:hypothetical protein
MSMENEPYYFPCVEDIKSSNDTGSTICPVCEAEKSFYSAPHNLRDCIANLLRRIKDLESAEARNRNA